MIQIYSNGYCTGNPNISVQGAAGTRDIIELFLLSLKAGGLGLNLTSADTVILYDPWWNPAAEAQAADRTHRIGQTRNVNIIKLLVKDSVEEKVLDLQRRKADLFNDLVEASAESAASMSLEDFEFLLRD